MPWKQPVSNIPISSLPSPISAGHFTAYDSLDGPDVKLPYADFQLPDLLFTLIAGGALVTAFLPVFTEYLTQDDEAGAWELASAVTNLVFLTTAVLAAGVALLASLLVDWVVAPGFDPAQQALTVDMMRIILDEARSVPPHAAPALRFL